jgi:hypothetical protein
MSESGFENRVGVTAEEIADIAFHRLMEDLQLSVPDGNPNQDSWTDAVEVVFEICTRQDEMRWEDLTTKFLQVAGHGPKKWGETPQIVRSAYEAMVRNVVNMIMAEDRGDFDLARNHNWSEWILKHSSRLQQERISDERISNA